MTSEKMKLQTSIPGTNIIIDLWGFKSLDECDSQIRFMTSITNHSVKTVSLIQKASYSIHTTLFNKWYLHKFYEISEDRIIVLDYNNSVELIDPKTNEKFYVTAIEANHCSGSTMFLFQGSFGNILYTGYFRTATSAKIYDVPALKAVIKKRNLHKAFIDNSYAAEHCNFPSRYEIIRKIVHFIRGCRSTEIVISSKHLGKEELLLAIASELVERIGVSEKRFQVFQKLGISDFFTQNLNEARIRVLDHLLNSTECREMFRKNDSCIIILLTALYQYGPKKFPFKPSLPRLRIFPYSGHCNHSELKQFISTIKPHAISPIVKSKTALPCSAIPRSIYDLCYQPEEEYDDLLDQLCTSSENSSPPHTEDRDRTELQSRYSDAAEVVIVDSSSESPPTVEENCDAPNDKNLHESTDGKLEKLFSEKKTCVSGDNEETLKPLNKETADKTSCIVLQDKQDVDEHLESSDDEVSSALVPETRCYKRTLLKITKWNDGIPVSLRSNPFVDLENILPAHQISVQNYEHFVHSSLSSKSSLSRIFPARKKAPISVSVTVSANYTSSIVECTNATDINDAQPMDDDDSIPPVDRNIVSSDDDNDDDENSVICLENKDDRMDHEEEEHNVVESESNHTSDCEIIEPDEIVDQCDQVSVESSTVLFSNSENDENESETECMIVAEFENPKIDSVKSDDPASKLTSSLENAPSTTACKRDDNCIHATLLHYSKMYDFKKYNFADNQWDFLNNRQILLHPAYQKS